MSVTFTGPGRAGRAAYALVIALALVGIAGCAQDPNSVAAQAKQGDNKGYVSGDGTVEQIAPDRRGTPVTLAGPTIDGGTFDLAGQAGGKVVVVNVWGSWCAPCVAEAPHLQRVWADVEARGEPVQFLGINSREDPRTGQAFAARVGLTFPSLSDKSGVQILALQGKAATTPTTLVLDRRHRIAARVSGSVSETTLTGLLDDAVAEP